MAQRSRAWSCKLVQPPKNKGPAKK
jgi:hypothetical protein